MEVTVRLLDSDIQKLDRFRAWRLESYESRLKEHSGDPVKCEKYEKWISKYSTMGYGDLLDHYISLSRY